MSPEPTTPTREELLNLCEATLIMARERGETDAWSGQVTSVARALKQHLTSEPGPVTTETEALAVEIAKAAGVMYFTNCKTDISAKHCKGREGDCRCSAAVKRIMALLAASTGARGAVVEEIAKRRARVTFTAGEHNEIVERLPPHFAVRVSKELGQYELDIAKLLALTTAAEMARALAIRIVGLGVGGRPLGIIEDAINEFLTTYAAQVRRDMREALHDSMVANERLIMMLEDSLANQTNDDGVKWERAITDVAITRDGGYRLSDARKAVHKARAALSPPGSPSSQTDTEN